jgi:hypothetical protein
VSNGVNQATAANILGEIMRLVFGTADATGFFMWGFHQESGAGATTLFAPSAALYTVNTSDFNNWTITEAGKHWQDMLGIADWDGDPTDGWTTQLNDLIVGADGTINFDGYWGDYELTVDGATYQLALSKDVATYSLAIAPGDFNGDQIVDTADYAMWRSTHGSTTDVRADGNGDGRIDEEDYEVWRALFGTTYGDGTGIVSTVPEPTTRTLLIAVAAALCLSMRRSP